jgi:stringent starvation protein B
MTERTSSASTRPYLIRALYEWCTDNGYTPYVAVRVDSSVRVPQEFVKDGEIVLNISFDATSSLTLGSEFIEFKARFAGTPREIMVPINNVMAIYARENGQGMAFPLNAPDMGGDDAPLLSDGRLRQSQHKREGETKLKPVLASGAGDTSGPEEPHDPPRTGPRPSLTRVK